jgi:hypothetical protein
MGFTYGRPHTSIPIFPELSKLLSCELHALFSSNGSRLSQSFLAAETKLFEPFTLRLSRHCGGENGYRVRFRAEDLNNKMRAWVA